MKVLLFIIILLWPQEPVKKDTVKVIPKLDVNKAYQAQNFKLDSIIAVKKANLNDTIK
jgi:hypothetical protein